MRALPPERIAVFGAYSAIAEATARRFAGPGVHFCLVGRCPERLASVADDLTVRGAAAVHVVPRDISINGDLAALVDQVFTALGRVDVALLAHGTLPDQGACEGDLSLTLAALDANGLSHLGLLTLLANRFAAQRTGTIAVITSVAGDRGRKSNYVYGTAKGAVSTFLQGLGHRLSAHGVAVVDIRPGFVDTPMTAAFAKGPLWAKPEVIARGIERAIHRRRAVVYLPTVWRVIMLAIRALPVPIFHKTNI